MMLQYELDVEERSIKLPSVGAYEDQFKMLLQRDLNFHGKNSACVSHTWHAFPAKFPPQLPRFFIHELTEAGEAVLDPMMGSCTTLIEAAILNRRAIGCDIDPLSLRLGPAKLRAIDFMAAYCAGKEVVKQARHHVDYQSDFLNHLLSNRFDTPTRTFVNYWFSDTTQRELMALLYEIEKNEDLSLRDFLMLVFSAIIITKSGGVSLSRDLAHTRPHKVEKTPHSALTEFEKRLQRNLQNIRYQPETFFHIYEADAQHLPLDENSVDLIVTSPPYANHAIDYMRAHKFSLVWMGFNIKQLSEIRSKFIGGDSVRNITLKSLPAHSEEIVQRLAVLDKKKSQAVHRYYSEMSLVLAEMHRVLKPGKAAVVVVGTSVMRGLNVETQNCLAEIGQAAGFRLVDIGIRRLDRDKRMMPARRQGQQKGASIEARMHEEYVIGFLKPEDH